ncbi:MAG: lipid A phosphoethanolamine transferase [Bacteroidales bacterium]|nr:lipid A phosphoethanolamine transferase [Bacteroidales bacterium]
MVLTYTENMPAVWKTVNMILPAGIYLLILSIHRRTGWITISMFPFFFFAAFQLVLLYLYGESIIAVDMYLNIVTTNMSEATELLGNLLPAIGIVVALYLPVLVWGIYAIVKKINMAGSIRKTLSLTGSILAVSGCVMAFGSMNSGVKGSFMYDVFPANVIHNMGEAINRTTHIATYPETSADYNFNARLIRKPDSREICVFVIGETSRAINWQLNGYHRATNPCLSKEPNLIFFGHAISESNTTHKSVPMLMSALNSSDFNDINYRKSILTAMKEAGYYTRFFSNQAPNKSYTEYFGNEADDTRYTDTENHPYDSELVEFVHEAVADTLHPKQFIVMHTYGSHFRYNDRYPASFSYFTPDNVTEATYADRDELINAYDNSIRFTDHVLSSVIGELKTAGCPCTMMYSSDHGEDIYDDLRHRFLHASPTPTYYQLHVAMLAWLSDEFCNLHPDMADNLRENSMRPVSPQKSMFNTAIDICGVETPVADRTKSLASGSYSFAHPVYLNDLNRAVPIEESGLKPSDLKLLSSIIDF